MARCPTTIRIAPGRLTAGRGLPILDALAQAPRAESAGGRPVRARRAARQREMLSRRTGPRRESRCRTGEGSSMARVLHGSATARGPRAWAWSLFALASLAYLSLMPAPSVRAQEPKEAAK